MYLLPTFDMTCGIFRNTNPNPLAPNVTAACQLRICNHVQQMAAGPTTGDAVAMTCLLPPLTDVRDGFSTTGFDRLEAPLGSGRFYRVEYADDVAKGFANEYRIAYLAKDVGYGLWPTPMP